MPTIIKTDGTELQDISITGNAATATAATNADTVDSYHATEGGADAHVIATDASGNAVVTGNVRHDGNLVSYKGAVSYTGYSYVPLTTVLTSTSWDGDAHSDEAWTKIDLSAVFGAPAGIKAVALSVRVRDSAAWGTGLLYIAFDPNASPAASGDYLTVYAFGGDIRNGSSGVVPCDVNGDIYYTIDASGTNTFDVWMTITGYFI